MIVYKEVKDENFYEIRIQKKKKIHCIVSSGSTETSLMAAVYNFTSTPTAQQNPTETRSQFVSKCADTSNLWVPCTCSLELCIGWYPCGLKFCKGKAEGRKVASTYRCGIKTCKKCFIFTYYTKMKQNCLWDE